MLDKLDMKQTDKKDKKSKLKSKTTPIATPSKRIKKEIITKRVVKNSNAKPSAELEKSLKVKM